MGRYAAALGDTVFWLGIEERGWGVVVAPPSEQREIAEELARLVPGRPAVELNADTTADWFVPIATAGATTPAGAFVYLAPELDDAGRLRVLQMLNGQRDRTSTYGVWVMVVSLTELENQVRRHAGDLASVFHHWQRVAFVPRTLTADELIAARAELHAHYQRRFGRLDLRGFIRSEQEDVSFAVEDIFQPLRARVLIEKPLHDLPVPSFRIASLESHLDAAARGIALLVGGPGSGKSFFLRWCALAASRNDQFIDIDRPIPVYVPLAVTRTLIELPPLADYVVDVLLESRLTIAHALAAEAAAGHVLFLLDGLDEVDFNGQALVDATAALSAQYPLVQVVVTSRPTGLDGSRFDMQRFEIEGLSDDAIATLLTTWCELYEIQRAGRDAAATGRADGERLAAEVLASSTLRELARSPLLATIIAIVHRAGVRLPDHRVELYERIVRILVERWNQLRSREAEHDAPIIRVQDAIRLLGPVALDMVAGGRDGAIEETSLHDLIRTQLARGTVRGIADADEALTVFRTSLGLLVEQAPGVYSFLHKTLGEFLAAHEIVRTRHLETLIAEPASCIDPRWREVILLALGIVGTLHADDERVATAVITIVASIHRLRTDDGTVDPSLLGGILLDDPALSPRDAEKIADELIPFWWLDRVSKDLQIERLAQSTWRTPIAQRFDRHYRDTLRSVYLRGDSAEHPWAAVALAAFHHPIELFLSEALVARAVREKRFDRVPSVLTVWHKLAALNPDGPQPPASVEEAVAKYGPPPTTAES